VHRGTYVRVAEVRGLVLLVEALPDTHGALP
jgi:hypothetical protein